MKFAAPGWLVLLPVLALVGAWLWRRAQREWRRRLMSFAAERYLAPFLAPGAQSARQRRIGLLALTAVALVVALARPLGGVRTEAARRQGVNVLIAVDGSRSMQVADVSPNRFALAQASIDRLLETMTGDRAGLLFFGGQATLVAPLTFDTASLRHVNRGLSPEWVGKGGTALAAVIRRAAEIFRDKPYASRVLLLVTDGEETESDAVLAAREARLHDGLRIFTLGTGTAAGGIVPRYERNAQRDYVDLGPVLDASGQEVVSKLDAPLLRRVAEVAGGSYLDLAAGGSLEEFNRQALAPLAAPMEDATAEDLTEWFPLPLALALLLLVIDGVFASRVVRPAAPAPATAATAAVLAAVALLLPGPPARAAATEDAARLMAVKDYAAAFTRLQTALLDDPSDLRARYNYGVAAYAAGKYPVAIETFERLATCAEPQIEPRSRAQLGNSHYRAGEEMRAANPAGTIAEWEKALAAYRQAPESPLAVHNLPKIRADLLGLLGTEAGQKLAAGDAAARLAVEQGVPAWREALARTDEALKLVEGTAETGDFSARRTTVAGRIYDAFWKTGADKERRAQLQKAGALERAIDLMAAAAGDYGEALGVRPGDELAKTAKIRAEATLDPWRVELADQRYAAGWKARPVALEDAIALWQQAAAGYTQVLDHDPAQAGALAGRDRNNHALHDALVELGDRQQAQADEPGLAKEERDPLLEQALGNYQSALGLEPGDGATQAKLHAVGVKLVDLFIARGQAELAGGRQRAAKQPPEAIASLERSVQSFNQALRFAPDHAGAKAGRKEAEDLLRELRAKDAESQRKVLGDGKDLKDPKDLEDPGKLALKLLDLDNDHLASKKQQNLSAPENRPLKDW